MGTIIWKSCENCGDKDTLDTGGLCKGICTAGCWLADTSAHRAVSKAFDEHPKARGFEIIPVYVSENSEKRATAPAVSSSVTGVKFDNGKPRFDLIPPEALFGLSELYRLGAEKYADRNWEKGMSFSRLFGAMQRHAWAFMSGEDYDSDGGQYHLLSVAWCALAIYTYCCRGLDEEFDDRPHKKLTTFHPISPDAAVEIAREVRHANH